MARFEILANDVVIGRSDLEAGDPPMGVAMGMLLPTEEYASIQSAIQNAEGRPVSGIVLSAREAGGASIPAQGGVRIDDHSLDIGPDVTAIDVSVLGIPYPLYERLFPAHVSAYKRQFQGVRDHK